MKAPVRNVFSSLALAALVVACGNNHKGSRSAAQDQQGLPEGQSEQAIEGLFQGQFLTLNPTINGTLPGSLTVLQKEERVNFYLRLFAGKPRAWHQQAIRVGARCPGPGDDSNGDGILDINEANAVWGDVLIPLDADPGAQRSGMHYYPLGDLSGSYSYERIVSFRRLLEDLYATDFAENDGITKLREGDPFGFDGRIVSVLGIDEKTILPESVGTIEPRRAFQNLPIACAVLRPVRSEPGRVDSGIPGPIAEIEEGQDRPGAPVYPTGTTPPSTGTGSNENRPPETGNGEGRSTGGSTGASGDSSVGHSNTGTSSGRGLGDVIRNWRERHTVTGGTNGSGGETTDETDNGRRTGGTAGGTTGQLFPQVRAAAPSLFSRL